MRDIRVVFDPDLWTGDLELEDGDLASDEGLQTAVILSLFTDRRAEPDDEIPDGSDDRRGFWGDAIPPIVDGETLEEDRFGSRLWLLDREKKITEVVNKAREYCEEALEWMIKIKIVNRIEIETFAQGDDILAAQMRMYRPNGDAVNFRFDKIWEAHNAL